MQSLRGVLFCLDSKYLLNLGHSAETMQSLRGALFCLDSKYLLNLRHSAETMQSLRGALFCLETYFQHVALLFSCRHHNQREVVVCVIR